MRAGEIVRIDEQMFRVDRVDRELIRIGDDFRNADAAEIVTVAELFAAAGHHYNTGLPLFYNLTDESADFADAMIRERDRRDREERP